MTPREHAFERMKRLLESMTREQEGSWRRLYNRWYYHHEPLRNDARNILKYIEEQVEKEDEQYD